MIAIGASFDDKTFFKEMNNIVEYSLGFVEGAVKGKRAFLEKIAVRAVKVIEDYIDSSARTNPAMLHHIYEWNKAGDSDSRLFDIISTVSSTSINLKTVFRQSQSIKDGSKTPFYDKARVIENGIPVIVKPKESSVLVFDVDGKKVFTRNPVKIDNPGGIEAEGGLERTLRAFFDNYMSQSFLMASGVDLYLKDASIFTSNIGRGKRGGKSVGVSIGYRWITEAGGK